MVEQQNEAAAAAAAAAAARSQMRGRTQTRRLRRDMAFFLAHISAKVDPVGEAEARETLNEYTVADSLREGSSDHGCVRSAKRMSLHVTVFRASKSGLRKMWAIEVSTAPT